MKMKRNKIDYLLKLKARGAKNFKLLLAIVLIVAAMSNNAQSQTQTAITGAVKDSAGAAIVWADSASTR